MLLDSALDPVLEEAAERGEEAILELKVLRSRLRLGHFLVAAAHRIAKRLALARTGDEEPSPEATRTALRDVVSRCLYGVESTRWRLSSARVDSGWRRSTPAARSPSSTPTSSPGTVCSGRRQL